MTLVPITTESVAMPPARRTLEAKILEVLRIKGTIAPTKNNVALYLKSQLGYTGANDLKDALNDALSNLEKKGLVKLTNARLNGEYSRCELVVQVEPVIAVASPPKAPAKARTPRATPQKEPAMQPTLAAPAPAPVIETVAVAPVPTPTTPAPTQAETPKPAPKAINVVEQLVEAAEEQARLRAADKAEFERQLVAKNQEFAALTSSHARIVQGKNEEIEQLTEGLRITSGKLEESNSLNATLREQLATANEELTTAKASLETFQQESRSIDELALRVADVLSSRPTPS